MPFYLTYLSTWPEAFTVAQSPDSSLMGYTLAKAEGVGSLWHGHVSAVTVAPTYRRLGLAKVLMEDLERFSEQVYNAYFVDLFVRASNKLAIDMYEKFGYVKYRRVLGYYSDGGGAGGQDDDDDEDGGSGMKDGSEDAWDMRKALRRDVKKKSIIPLDHPVLPGDLEW
jgi:Acetyltransferases